MAAVAIGAPSGCMHMRPSYPTVASSQSLVRPRCVGMRSRALWVVNVAAEPAKVEKRVVSKVELRTLRGCALGVSWFPDFVYNGEGGGGVGYAEELPEGLVGMRFDTEAIHIPPLSHSTATFLGVPLPPPLRIRVKPQLLEGIVDLRTGKVEMRFVANFFFSAGPWYNAPPLFVDTLLTTDYSQGKLRNGQGSRLDTEGLCRLVGIAPLIKTEDPFLNIFLSLPTDCLANMSAQFLFS
ncbi:hypothetical protein O6H91_15G062000 [Diphasiastrum complanatum]|uniref:Uncharacterized protein n=1 Tax=Diphasiastrum complanatum TaxID=34168 RepID=A0ACC2BIZ5_DIPCM|nr:hypothetical protein O6H91_15G062000 [Diphasiastrum complanatum]